MKKNSIIFTSVLVLLLTALVYSLGFASNISYGNDEFIEVVDINNFNDKVQVFNNLLHYSIIGLVIILVGCYLTNSHNRKKYEISNIISVGLMSFGLAIFGIINLVKLPGFIKEYTLILANHGEELKHMAVFSSLNPTNTMYYFGLVISSIMLLFSGYMVVFIVLKMKNQKRYLAIRDEVLSNEA